MAGCQLCYVGAAPRPKVAFVSPMPVRRPCAARPRRTGLRNRPPTARRRRPDRRERDTLRHL